MATVNPSLLAENKRMETKLHGLSTQYWSANDIRWMFAFAHFRITQQIKALAVLVTQLGASAFSWRPN